ncbi:MAG: flavodoxin family protein [Pleurocapsa sp. MO_192.B19]|nr:flavodoxin family protein [Pleurocapsa sp. MO_192.B19]
MTTISVVYHSGTGHTRKMAEAVLAGAASVGGVETQMIAIEGKDIVEGRWQNDKIMEMLDQSDAIIFGSPTYMGCVSGQMKSFLDATSERYLSRAWVDKIASAFTVSAGLSGDKLNTLSTIAICMMQHGMIWVGLEQTPFNDKGINRLCFYLGAAGQALHEPLEEAPNDQDKETGRLLGIRVASLTKKLKA